MTEQKWGSASKEAKSARKIREDSLDFWKARPQPDFVVTTLKRSKSRSLGFVERENIVTLFLFGNGLSPFTLFVLIGAIGGEIKIVVEV